MPEPRVWIALGAALVVSVVGIAGAGATARSLAPGGFESSTGESRVAEQALTKALGHGGSPGMVILARGRVPARSGVYRVAMETVISQLRADSAVFSVRRGPVSRDRRTSSLLVSFRRRLSGSERAEAAQRIRRDLDGGPLKLGVGGRVAVLSGASDRLRRDLLRSALPALPIALLLLAWACGGVAAAAIPVLAATVAISGTLLFLRALAGVIEVSSVALLVAVPLAAGLSFQQGSLAVRAWRRNAAGASGEGVAPGLVRAGWSRGLALGMAAAGAPCAALAAVPQRGALSMALGGVAAVGAAGVTALVVTPALLGALPPGVERLLRRDARSDRGPRYPARAVAALQRHPAPLAVLLVAGVGLGAVSLRDTELTGADARLLERSSAVAAVERRIARSFGADLGGPVLVAAEPRDRRGFEGFRRRLRSLGAVERLPLPGRAVGRLRPLALRPGEEPQSGRSREVLGRARGLRAGFPAPIGGETARTLDQRRQLVRRLPLALGALVMLAGALLLASSRSLALPVKALAAACAPAMAGLAAAALVIGEGHLTGPLDYRARGGVELGTVLALPAVLAALSLWGTTLFLARLDGLRAVGLTPREQVARATAETAPALAAAVLPLAAIAAAWAGSGLLSLKELGMGLGAGLLVEAVIVRLALGPALMALAAGANWWLPSRARRAEPEDLESPVVLEQESDQEQV